MLLCTVYTVGAILAFPVLKLQGLFCAIVVEIQRIFGSCPAGKSKIWLTAADPADSDTPGPPCHSYFVGHEIGRHEQEDMK